MTKEGKMNILRYTLPELKDTLKELGIQGFVATQIFDWIYGKYVTDFEDMRNISKKNRSLLSTHFTILPFLQTESLPSQDGLACKYILELESHQFVEAVALKEKSYETLCVSSQSGCPVNCSFCLTGVAGLKKQLTREEIIAQVLLAKQKGHPITHLVFMGMGEPLLNFDEVFGAIRHLCDESTFNFSKRKITVSTSGILQGIKRLIEEDIVINLAFSVGHPTPEKRQKLMPIEERNPIFEVSRLLSTYNTLHNRKLTLEYTLLKDQNDDEEALTELANLAKFLKAKVNLINLNPHPKIPHEPVSNKTLRQFQNGLREREVPVTVRVTKGQDIIAACGQLGESLLS